MRNIMIIACVLLIGGCSSSSDITPEQYLENQEATLLKSAWSDSPKRDENDHFWFYSGPVQIENTPIYRIFVVRESDNYLFSAMVDADTKFNVGDEVNLIMVSQRNHVGAMAHFFSIQR